MDDYPLAFISRCLDTKHLYTRERKILAMHLGGISLECLLKKTCFLYHGITKWGERSVRTGVKITNPKHRLYNIVMLIGSLHTRVDANPSIMDAIEKVQEPCGKDYILWRYQGVEPLQADFDAWYTSYQELLKWLLVQVKTL
ncbi:hypothetical protein [Tumebacillus permanentifrigoris]|uniref:Uncharacterized protein n=1 Tax=Tumebacillus permanentifrigoris TaxID=378543 RepID=A0A316DFU6_9BACL|nr:hypothetical protein [Tumebacillus permanentifrigoris]PWK16526.1 hypothetical protein C7459_101392 [Tumebacillus permanentifrigoris]